MGRSRKAQADANRAFLIGLSRAFGGAVFFSLPLLMTMEMWALAAYLDAGRIALLVLAILPVLVVLDRFSGFMPTSSWAEDALDGLIAFGVGAIAATVILAALGLLHDELSLRELAGRVALQAVPGSFGAVLANSQFSADQQEKEEDAALRRGGYPAQLFFMLVGAVFLAFNIAPTEEVVLLASQAQPLLMAGLVLLTLAMMHAFVYASGFRGTPASAADASGPGLFFRYTLAGYAVAMLVSGYVLWTFGRLDGTAPNFALAQAVVLCLPAGLGAAAARLVL